MPVPKEKLRVVLVRPPQPYIFADTHYPIGLSVLGARLAAAGHTVSGIAVETMERAIMPEADWYLITSTTPSYPSAVAYARRLRSRYPYVRIAIGGPHSSAIPERVVQESAFDKIVVGEADDYVVPLVEGDLHERIIQCALPNDISTVPLRSLFPPASLKVEDHRAANVMLTRGCPYRCRFCASAGIKYRRRTRSSIQEEFAVLKQLGYKALVLNDDLPTLDEGDLNSLCELLREAGLLFRMNIRADFVTNKRIALLKESGCIQLNIGVENPDDKILRRIDKHLSSEKLLEAFAIIKQHQVKCKALLIHGLPGTGFKEAERMVAFLKKARPDFVVLSSFVPVPGSAYWNDYKSLGWSEDQFLYHGKSGNTKDVDHFPNGVLSPEELAKLKKRVCEEIEEAGILIDYGEASLSSKGVAW